MASAAVCCTREQGHAVARNVLLGRLRLLYADCACCFGQAGWLLLRCAEQQRHGMQEAVKGVKHAAVPGVFAGVLSVLYTVLLGHHSMQAWVQAALAQHTASLPSPQVPAHSHASMIIHASILSVSFLCRTADQSHLVADPSYACSCHGSCHVHWSLNAWHVFLTWCLDRTPPRQRSRRRHRHGQS